VLCDDVLGVIGQLQKAESVTEFALSNASSRLAKLIAEEGPLCVRSCLLSPLFGMDVSAIKAQVFTEQITCSDYLSETSSVEWI